MNSKHLFTDDNGITKKALSISTSNPSIIERVRGSLIVIVVPELILVSILTSPRRSDIFLLTTSIPTPLPDIFVMLSEVVKPGRNIKSRISFALIAASA